ncbi:hypothetical protein BGW36DRAFT_428016 [Talaromyces proteolyticus]|uniref:Uncharacterized protein n=1 Tax=Talaromyces proteolyticus TaxID=1131652 RepID=A0AAD4PZ29_9EURO|nr:uncharacterized protein BGW36DRAFT_428016 [Talaromyces proteolyticus]KAH8695992.1 hypothetical protein BGW36DRAFT_428016 [Talaromyces proteolyticus]
MALLPFTCKPPHMHHHPHHSLLAIHLTDKPYSPPVSVNPQYLTATAHHGSAAWKTLVDNTTAASLSPCLTDTSDTKTFYSAIQVIDISSDSEDPVSMAAPNPKQSTGSSDSTNNQPENKATQKSKTSPSRASSTSQRAPRSPSSSTAGTSRRERRGTASVKTNHPASPSRNNSIQMSSQKRDELLALHRDSCRLFQDIGMAADPIVTSHDETYPQSTATSPAMSPIMQSQRSHSFPVGFLHDGDISEEDLLSVRRLRRMSNVHSEPDQTPYDPVPATVIDWTSPSTRRREYEAIDRSNKGIRRIWRRITPRCFHSSDSRTPFFETREDGKPNYEGSVRRFRMDIPDEKEELDQRTDGLTSGPKLEKRKWSCF